MKRYRSFLFDLDGTLTDSGEGVLKSVQYALEYFGIHVEDWHTLGKYMGPPLQDSFREFEGFDEEQTALAIARYRERYNVTGLFENRVYEGIPDVLRDLKSRGARILVATSNPEVTSLRVLEHFGLTKYFDVIVGSEFDGRRSRKSEVIEEAFRRAGISSEDRRETLMIGDRWHDIRGAKEAGVDSMGTYSGYAEPGELEGAGATYVVHTIREMRELLNQLCASPGSGGSEPAE